MTKGKNKKQAILKTGIDMASRTGLENLSIGTLAKAMKMSKSGLYAHFQSKENLLTEILNHAAEDFSKSVIVPALMTDAGISRIHALVDQWIVWSSRLAGGCIFVSAGTEFSGKPGKVRDCLLQQQEEWIDTLSQIADSAVEAGEFSENIDRKQFAFDLYSLLLGFYYYDRLLQDRQTKKRQEASLNRLLANYRRIESTN